MPEGEADEEQTRRAPPRGPGCLTIVRGGQLGLSYRVGDKTVVIGRGESADVMVVGDGISRKHVELVRDAMGAIELVDLGSRNGTFVNRVRVSRTTLEDGDRIRIGDTEFDFRYEQRDDRATVDLAAKRAGPIQAGLDPSDSVSLRFVTTMSNLAQVHFSGGRYRKALGAYERARSSLEHGATTNVAPLTVALLGIGQCHLELGELERARAPLQRAVDLLQARGSSEAELAGPRFALARALGNDDDRARSLAEMARDALDTAKPADRELFAKISGWLDAARSKA